MKINETQSVKSNGIKNILKCFLIIVFVNAFWACKKYETQTNVYDVSILSASITEIGTTTADFTIIVSEGWALDDVGVYFWGNTAGVNFSWIDWEVYWDLDLGMQMYKTVFQMEGLRPETSFACQAYIRVDTLEVEGEIVYFVTDSE